MLLCPTDVSLFSYLTTQNFLRETRQRECSQSGCFLLEPASEALPTSAHMYTSLGLEGTTQVLAGALQRCLPPQLLTR